MMAVNIANALAESNVESHLCATRQEGNLKAKLSSDVGYLFLNKKRVMDFMAMKKLYQYLVKYEIDIIHAHSTSYFTAFLSKLRFPNITIIWHDHYGYSENLKSRKKFPLTLISKTFKTVISVNSSLHQWAKQNLKAKQYKYLPNFASFESTISESPQLLGTNEKRIVCLANLRPQKDHLNLLKTFRIMREIHKDWSLHLVGMDFKDAYAEEIKAYMAANNLNACVFLYGSCADTQFILGQATIGVLPSKSEGLPVALLEYGLAKLPVVVTDVGECGIVVKNLENGLVVPPNQADKLAEALLYLIENETQRKVFGENLCENVNTNYSQNYFIKHLIEIYKLE